VATMTRRSGGGGMWLQFAQYKLRLSCCHRRPWPTPGDNARLACVARGAE